MDLLSSGGGRLYSHQWKIYVITNRDTRSAVLPLSPHYTGHMASTWILFFYKLIL